MHLAVDQIFAGRYRLLGKIGVGGFSEVWKVADEMAEDRIMVLKVYAPERGLDEFGIKQFRREYAITQDLNHPNLLKANYFDIANGSPFLIMPFCEGGSLYSKIQHSGTLNEPQLAQMLLQIASGLEYLHRRDIVHQDIKSDNVLVDGEGNYLLTDFGISSKLRSTLQKSTTAAKAMTVAYAPPEKFKGNAVIGPEGDIFSLGVLIIEVLTDHLPWNGMGGAYVRPDSEAPTLPVQFSDKLNLLIQRCLTFAPNERPTASEIKLLAQNYLSSNSWGNTSSEAPREASRVTEVYTNKSSNIPPKDEKPPISAPAPSEKPASNEIKPKRKIGFAIFANFYTLLANIIGAFAFCIVAFFWNVWILDYSEYGENTGYDAVNKTGFNNLITNVDLALYCLNIIGYSLWVLLWVKFLSKAMRQSGFSKPIPFILAIAQATMALAISLSINVLFIPLESSPFDEVVLFQWIASLVIVIAGCIFSIRKFANSNLEDLENYTFWWKPITVAIGSFVLAFSLVLLRTKLM